MKKSVQLMLMFILVSGFAVLAVILYPRLPAQIPMQWGLNGKVNYAMPKLPIILVMLLVETGFALYSAFLHRAETVIPLKDFLTSLTFPIIFTVLLLLTQIRF